MINYVFFGVLIALFMEIDHFAEIGKQLYFWIFCLSFLYFLYMAIKSNEKMESNYVSGVFHALWALSLTNLIISAFFVVPFHEHRDNLPLLFEIIIGLFVFFTLSIDFVINKLLIQRVIAAIAMTVILLFYGLYVAYQHNYNNIDLPVMIKVKGYHILFYLIIYKMLNEIIWLCYTYIHPYKFKLKEAGTTHSTINLETVNVTQ